MKVFNAGMTCNYRYKKLVLKNLEYSIYNLYVRLYYQALFLMGQCHDIFFIFFIYFMNRTHIGPKIFGK